MTSKSARERRDVSPVAEARIDARVVARIEARVRAVDRIEERQQMDAAEESAQGATQQRREIRDPAARQPIDVGDQLDLVLHWRPFTREARPSL